MDLLIECLDVGWEEAMKIECVSLLGGESRAFVMVGRCEESGAGEGAGLGTRGGKREMPKSRVFRVFGVWWLL